ITGFSDDVPMVIA
nr:Chain C, C-terminal fragment of Sortilin-related receptor [synthetic construct]3G2S_D Chain D, C-terminal fragment of Sortilin-related receptor [synthetic construct]